MVINTNVAAQGSADLLAISSSNLAKSLQRLSSGSKIVSPDDDAPGLAVSMKFDAQSKRIGAAVTNISNAISFTKTQDGYLGQIAKALTRMGELAVSAQDETKVTADKLMYNDEFAKLAAYVKDIEGKEFNGVSLFNDATGSASRTVTVNDGGTNNFTLAAVNLGAADYLGVSTTPQYLAVPGGAVTALAAVKVAITQLAADRSAEASNLTRLNYSKDQLIVQKTNVDAANSVIKDVDVATESTNFAKQNIFVQSGTAMLAQANTSAQSVLRLLG